MKKRPAVFIAGRNEVQRRVKNFVIDKRIVHQLFIIKRQDKITFAFFQVEHRIVDVNRFNMKSFILSVGITGDDFRK